MSSAPRLVVLKATAKKAISLADMWAVLHLLTRSAVV